MVAKYGYRVKLVKAVILSLHSPNKTYNYPIKQNLVKIYEHISTYQLIIYLGIGIKPIG